MSRFYLSVLFLAALVFASPIEAQENVPATVNSSDSKSVTLPQIDVFAERPDISHQNLTPGEIETINNSGNMGNAMDSRPGLETQGEGLGKTWNTLSIRGQSFRETVILLNGVRVPESFNLGTIPTDDIEKVEVIEGPQALAYGSDALGGVLNIVTRGAVGKHFQVAATGGEFNTYQFRATSPSFGTKNFRNTLSGSWFTTDGYAPLPATAGPNGTTYLFTDEVHWDVSQSAFLDLGTDQLKLSSQFFRHIGSAPDADNVIAAGTDQYDLDGRQNAWGLQSTLADNHALGAWTMTPSLFGDYSDVLRSNPIGADPTSGVYNPYRNQYLDYGGQLYFSGPVDNGLPRIKTGLEWREESLFSGLYGNHARDSASLVLDGTWKAFEKLSLDFSNRLNHYTFNGWSENPTGTLVYTPASGLNFHLSIGKGEKIPTYDQLYLPYTDFASLPPNLQPQFNGSPFASAWAGDKGNPNLLPEESINTELGGNLAAGNWLFQAAGFLNSYHNFINPQVDPSDNFWTYANIDKATFIGTEGGVRYRFTDLLASRVSATYIRATDQNGNDIQGRLHFKFTAGLDLQLEKSWSLGVEDRYVEQNPVAVQYLTDLGFPAPTTNYWCLSAHTQYHVSDHLKGFLEVDNLLNDQMASFQGLPLPGRTFQCGLESEF